MATAKRRAPQKSRKKPGQPFEVLGAATALLDAARIPSALPSGKPDPGMIVGTAGGDTVDRFIRAIAKHRHYEREAVAEPVPVPAKK